MSFMYDHADEIGAALEMYRNGNRKDAIEALFRLPRPLAWLRDYLKHYEGQDVREAALLVMEIATIEEYMRPANK